MHPVIVLHLPVFLIVKDSLSRWYVIHSGWYLPDVDLQHCWLRTTGGKVFPVFAKLYFWQRLSDGKACNLCWIWQDLKSQSVVQILLLYYCFPSQRVPECTSMLMSLVLHGMLTYTYVFYFSALCRAQMYRTCCMERDPAFVCPLSVSWRL